MLKLSLPPSVCVRVHVCVCVCIMCVCALCDAYGCLHYVSCWPPPSFSLSFQDLSRLGRNLRETILLDDNPNAYLYHPENAIPINGN